MATYTTKKCPYCGHAYKVMEMGDQQSYGCPLKTCLMCHNRFWDPDIKEPALYGYYNSHELMKNIKGGCAGIIAGITGIIFAVGGIWMLIDEGNLMGLFLLIFGSAMVGLLVYSLIKSNSQKDKEKELKEQQRGYDSSFSRLQDYYYLKALAEHDNLAEKLLNERLNGEEEHYAERPE